MRSLVNLLVLAAVATIAASCTSTAPVAVVPWQGFAESALARADLQYYWQMTPKTLGLLEGEVIDHLCKLDENIYCITNRDRLICVDADRRAAQVEIPGGHKRRIHLPAVPIRRQAPD